MRVLIGVGVGAPARKRTAMLKVVQDNNEFNDQAAVVGGGSLLDEIVGDGARAMLAAASQAEVAASVEALHADTQVGPVA